MMFHLPASVALHHAGSSTIARFVRDAGETAEDGA